MGGWKSVKGLFWQSGKEPPPPAATEEMSDADLAALLAQDEFGVSAAPVELSPEDVLDVGNVEVHVEAGAVSVDFQSQYDRADIPNTDEVEKLEGFLAHLDDSLPQASKIAAAHAFLGAVGKSTADVLNDAARKIAVVRKLQASREQATRQSVMAEQSAIEDLQKHIDQRRQAIEAYNAELEGFKHACAVEEARLQGARVFFGHITQQGKPGAPA